MDKESLIFAVREGLILRVEELVNLFDFDANDGSEGYDILLNALEKNHGNIAKVLLLNGYRVNINNDYSITPLHYAAKHGDMRIVKMLLDRNAKIDAKDKYGRTSLHYAVEQCQIKIIKLLLNRRACVNASDRDGITPLHVASKEACIEVVKILLNYGAYINPTSYLTPRKNICEGYTPLHYAVENGNQEISKLLLKSNTDLNIKALRGTPLHIAAEEGYLQIVEDLLNCGAYVNSVCSSTGYTPLHLASTRGNTGVVRLLLIKGADVNSVAADNLMPLYLASEKGHGAIVKLLLEYGADVNPQDKYVDFKASHGSLLHIAAQEGYQGIVEYLLNYEACVNSVCISTGYTPLHIASASGNMAIVEWMLSKGADVKAIDNNNLTPLYMATERLDEAVVKLLLEHGADVDAQNKEGKTVLHLAVEKGHSAIVENILLFCPDLSNKSNKNSLNFAICKHRESYRKIVENLLEYGFTVNTKDINNFALIDGAIMSKRLDIVEDFLRNGANVNMTSDMNRFTGSATLLHSAIASRQEEMAELLISYGANVNIKHKYSPTPVSHAIYSLDLKMTKLLLRNGANWRDFSDIFSFVVRAGSIEIVETLLQYKSDIDFIICNKFGRRTLGSTILGDVKTKSKLRRSERVRSNSRTGKGNTIITQMHLNNRAIINAKNKDGSMPLHIACYGGNEKIVEILLKYGAEVNARGKNDMTPLHVAAERGHPRVIENLLKYGADIDSIDKYGRTALHIACEGGHVNIVITLLEIGADINIMSRDNLTALNFAMPSTILFWQLEARYNDYDLDDDDDFDEEIDHPEISLREEIAEILLRHIAKAKEENLFLIKEFLHTINANPNLKYHYVRCREEIRKMKNEKVGNNISFYDILTNDVHQLAIYARNKHVVDIFKSREYKKIFPRYADMLENQFKKGEEREGLLDSSIKSFNFLFGYEVPYLFIDRMFSYLSNFDLKNLIEACSHSIIDKS